MHAVYMHVFALSCLKLNMLNLRSKSRSMVTIFCRFNSFCLAYTSSMTAVTTRSRSRGHGRDGMLLESVIRNEIANGQLKVVNMSLFYMLGSCKYTCDFYAFSAQRRILGILRQLKICIM